MEEVAKTIDAELAVEALPPQRIGKLLQKELASLLTQPQRERLAALEGAFARWSL